MAFSIDAFRSAIEAQGGLARVNLFNVRFSGFRSSGSVTDGESASFTNRDLEFFCQSVRFPGINVEVFNHRPNNIDNIQSIPYAIGHRQLECLFMVDDRHRVLNYFHSWMRKITNFSPSAEQAPQLTSGQRLQYELGYKKDYIQNMSITMYSRSPQIGGRMGYANGYICNLTDVYPVEVGDVDLSWSDNDSYGTLPVALSYGSYELTPIVNGVIQPIPQADIF